MIDEDFAVLTALFVATLLLMSPVPRAVAATLWTSSLHAMTIDATAVEDTPSTGSGLMPM